MLEPTKCMELEYEETQLQYKKEQHLRDRGWTHSSAHPGCVWLWTKTLKHDFKRDGSFSEKPYSLPFELAWSIEKELEADEALDAEGDNEDEEEENCCEHGDHPAPVGQRFCSKECADCESSEQISDHGCNNICRLGEVVCPVCGRNYSTWKVGDPCPHGWPDSESGEDRRCEGVLVHAEEDNA